jgi:imidazolonepropionase-like amidohydrolase
LRLMTEAGMSPMEAIVASTRTAAACLGMEAELGTLEEGKLADLLVFDGDPLQNIAALEETTNIEMVVKNGCVAVDRRATTFN